MSSRTAWNWEPIEGSTVGLFAPERYGLEEPVATITAVANEAGRIELLTYYVDPDGVQHEGPVEKSATTAERVAAGLAYEARIEWAHRQMLAARVALDAGRTEEALALLAGAERQRELGVADA